jgi:hypothetical protein
VIYILTADLHPIQRLIMMQCMATAMICRPFLRLYNTMHLLLLHLFSRMNLKLLCLPHMVLNNGYLEANDHR